MIKRSLTPLMILMLALAACGGSEAAEPTADSDGTGTTAAAQSETGESETGEPETGEPEAEEPEAGEPEEATGPATVAADLAGIEIIEIALPADGNGERPKLEWSEVPGAAEYTVILNTADGGPYWAWTGPGPEVWIGGSTEEPPPNSEGPSLFEPLTMHVFATDAAGEPVGASQPTVIAP